MDDVTLNKLALKKVVGQYQMKGGCTCRNIICLRLEHIR